MTQRLKRKAMALVICVVLLAAVGTIIGMAMGIKQASGDPSISGTELFESRAGGTFCIDAPPYCTEFKLSYAAIGPYTILQGEEYGCGYECPTQGTLYSDATHYYVGLHNYPVKDSGYAGVDWRGSFDKKTLTGTVYWNNPQYGTNGSTTWKIIPCPTGLEAVPCEGCLDPVAPA